MHVPTRSWSVLACAIAVLVIATSASAQIEDQVGDYTAANGEGYLQPLADAIGADLNGGIWHTAYVPTEGFYIALETRLLATFFGDDQLTFNLHTGTGRPHADQRGRTRCRRSWATPQEG